MAEIALLATIIPKLISLLENEMDLHQNIRSALRTIRGELENMKAFLTMAENSDTPGNLLEEVWVNQVRELAFESEDIVDEFILELEKNHLFRSCTCLASMFHSLKHDFALRMKEIILRFEEVCRSNKRYRRVELPSGAISTSCYNPQHDPLFKDHDTLVGIERHKRHLIDMLVCNNYSWNMNEVVSVYGAGGVGKTSLVRKVYDDEEVKKNFHKQVWITVSRTFEPDGIFRDMIRQLQKEVMQEDLDEFGDQIRGYGLKLEFDNILQNMSTFELQQKASEILRKCRYLIVLDDIWSTDAWNTLRYTFFNLYGSRVLITTRNAEIALVASNGQRTRMFELEPLSDEHSLPLFCTKAFNTDSCPDEFAEVTRSILKKCAGVPLAIVAIAAALVTRDRSVIEWEKVNANIGIALDGSHTLRVLSLSYTDLPYHIKPCYLYLSIFPEDYLIQKRRLIRLWIAEGFIPRMNNMTLEEVAESYLKQLEQRCLIQVVDKLNDGNAETYRVHDLLRDLIIGKATYQSFAAVAKENSDEEPWPVNVRRLSFHSNLSDLVEVQNKNLQQLRSIFVFDASMPSLFSTGFEFKLLTVLDMQGADLKKFPTAILALTNLKYLNLSHTDLESVPSSVHKLWKLETLDLKYTRIAKLPVGILKLKRLRNLLVYQYKNDAYGPCGFSAPKGLERLQSLQSLLFVDADSDGFQNMVTEIGKLAQLRRLGITNLGSKDFEDLSSLGKLHHLQLLSLSCSEGEGEAMDLPAIVSPSNQTLGSLYLTGKLLRLPIWMPMLQNLVHLFLQSSKLLNDPLDTLGQLPSLVHLELVEACTLDYLLFRNGQFGKLKTLGLHEFKSLERVILENGTMPNLEWFRMVNCKELKMVPAGIEQLTKLSLLDFVNMPSAIMTENVEKLRCSIKEVNWIYKEEDNWKTTRSTTAGNLSDNVSQYQVEEIFVMEDVLVKFKGHEREAIAGDIDLSFVREP